MDAQCLNALPSVERGIVRDIFNPVEDTPEPYSLDLVQEYSRFSQSQSSPVQQQSPSKGNSSPSPSNRPVTNAGSTPSNTSNNNNGSDRFNCAPCKKSFGSEATWNSHQKSSKHIAAVKEAEKKAKGGRGGGGGGGSNQQKNNSPNNRSKQQQEAEQEPLEVTEALMSFRKVEKIVKENPGMAASVMWKISKVLWSYRYTQETAKVLTLLVQTLTTLQSSPAPAAPIPGTLSPTQISMTLYLSRLALARLVIYQSPSLACELYLDAIQGRWQIDPANFQQMCEMVSTSSVTRLLDHCSQYLTNHSKTEKLMQPPTVAPSTVTTTTATPVKKSDPNLKLLTVLVESASLLAQAAPSTGYLWESSGTGLTIDDRTHAEIAIVQNVLAASLAQASLDWATVLMALRRMARVYQRLGMKYAAAACLLHAGQTYRAHGDEVNGTIQEDALWDLLQALVLALETADFVRMQAVLGLLEKYDHGEFRDIQAIMEVSRAVISQDNDFLHNNAALVLNHLSLLAQDSSKDQLLLSRRSASSECSARLLRLQKLVS
ncbi:hypothetical protein MVEG_02925 [Podila verticillata NRRL 6337]|nr:hypothetical protein MVEG_02925 [Podila verticillata NRRL 6337]